MKKLLSTTALVFAVAVPGMALAQTAPATEGQVQTTGQTQSMDNAGFLTARNQNDLFASELIGRDVYVSPAGMAPMGGQASATPGAAETTTTGEVAPVDGTGNAMTDGTGAATTQGTGTMMTDETGVAGGDGSMTMVSRADIESWENIGQINDIVMTNDGEVRAILIGIGGFLGVGEQDLAVTMDQVTFGSDREDPSEIYVIVNTDVESLRTSPGYDRTGMATQPGQASMEQTQTGQTQIGEAQTGQVVTGEEQTASGGISDRDPLVRPNVEREGYTAADVSAVTADNLVGKTVYGVNDDSVGTVDDLIIDPSGQVSAVVIDFGGFLGIGSSQVALSFEELTVLADEGYTDVRVYVDATREQIESLPRYE